MNNSIMQIRYLLLILCISKLNLLNAQTDFYDQLKLDYDRLRKEEKHDSSLVIAKQMNAWAYANETDTSLRYAVSLRYLGNCFNKLQTEDSVLFYWDKSLKILEQQGRSHCMDAERCFRNKGRFYEDKGDYSNAVKNYERAHSIVKKIRSEDHPDYATSLNSFGDLYFTMGDYKSAERMYKQSIEILKKTIGEEHLDVAKSLFKLGDFYETIGDYKSAEPIYKQSLAIRKKALGEEHSEVANSLISLGNLYSDMGDYKSAESYYKQSAEIYMKALGEDHPNVANSFFNLGGVYSDMGDYKSAESYYKQSLEIYRKVLGDEHLDIASSMNNLGILYHEMGDYKSAEPLYKQSSEIYKNVLGEEHPDVAMSLNNLGSLYSDMGDYKSAEPLYKQTLEIYKNALGEVHLDVAMSLNNLGSLYSDMGDYKFAEPFYKQSLEICRKALGEEHPNVASSLDNLGSLYSAMGDYKSAEPLYKQSLEIRRKAFGEEHPDVSLSLNNLGVLYSDMGNYTAAEALYKQSLEIRKKALGEEHADVAGSLNNLGDLYFAMGDYKSADPLFKQSLEIYKKAFGEEHPDVAMSLNNLGVLYKKIGDYKSAEALYKQSLEIRKKALGEEHPDVAGSLNNLGALYRKIGDYKSAEPLYKQSLEIRMKALGEEHPVVASSLNNLGILYSDFGNYPAAEAYYQIGFDKKVFQLKLNFSWLSSKEKEAFWQDKNGFYFGLNSFSAKAADKYPLATVLSFNGSLISKSLLLETSRELDRAIAESANDTLKSQFAEMKHLRRLYSKMQSENSDRREVMESVQLKADSLDKILVNKLSDYAASKRKFEITWKDIQSNLTPSDAAIEFARYFDDDDSSHKYMALVVRPGYEYPRLVKLAPETDIKNALAVNDFALLYELVWQGIDTLLTGVNTVYYSPVGELNNIAFSALCFEAGDSLKAAMSAANRGILIGSEETVVRSCNAVLMDKYTLHQLTTTRYLADGTLKKDRPLNSSITLLGGINYDDVPKVENVIEREESEQDFALIVNLTDRNKKKGSRRSSSAAGRPMEPLQGTREEVTHIATQLDGSWSVQTMSDRQAAEHGLKSQLESNSPGVLHIATHGFAFPDVKRDDSEQLMMDEKPTYSISEDPMVRCGLMLSGSNISWTGNAKKMIEQTGDDGILTAAEVSNLDLSGTKLVVLSACETGLGKIEGSEGTFGLKRGFKLAGVEQMIVSLWSVPDKETMELMTLFYTDLTKTLNPVQSFEKAQKQMRNLYPTQPDKWAGFVLVR